MSLHQERLAAEFKRALSEAIREINDPRLSKMCAISDVQITKDLKHAKAWVSIFDNEPTRAESIEILNHAGGILTPTLNKLMRMRRIPQVHFVLDEGIEHSVHISKLINEINQSGKTASDAEESIESEEQI